MKYPIEHPLEEERLKQLYRYSILDTAPEEKFDEVVEFVQEEFGVPISLISLVDSSRQWFKAAKGLEAKETGRDISFCGHAILEGDVFEVQDASKDPRFSDNPLVTNDPNIKFYAGAQLITEEGLPLGTLCIIDSKPRRLTHSQKKLLRLLATQVMRLIESRKQKLLLDEYTQVIHAEKKMLEAISNLQKAYIKGDEGYRIFSRFLGELLQLTQSEYGFIGEVLTGENGSPFLKTHAITDISWNDETSHWYKKNAPNGLEFTNLDTLFGYVIKSGELLIANDAPNHSLSGGIPPGHPPLNRFLGIPFKKSGELIGMIGFANRPDDYTENLVDSLKPVLDTCTQLIISYREKESKRQSEARLQKEQEKSRKLAEYFNSIYRFSQDGIVEVDPVNGSITDCNEAFSQMLGYTLNELIGMTVDDISIEKGHIAQLLKKSKEEGQGSNTLTIEKEYIHRNGHHVPVEVDVFWSRNEKDDSISLWGLVRNLTEQKEKELKRIQEQKMNSLGTLSGGVAHDFNNILSIILSNAELAAHFNQNEKVAKRLETIKEASQRGAELSRKILSFARKSEVKKASIDLKETLSTSLQLVESLIPSSIKLAVELDDVGNVTSNQNDISQILLNLISNAVQAISPNSGKISVKLSSSPSLKDAIITIEDDGEGIKESILQKIFDPFFTTKHQKNGTGLGLSTVFAIVEEMDGEIIVDSKVGEGTKFEIHLPTNIDKSISVANSSTEVGHTDRQMKILILEDEPALLEVYTESLRARTHSVEGYSDGTAALEALDEANGDIDVIITDDEMPNMKGTEFIQKAILRNPNIFTILVTGNVSEEAARLQGERVIQKVFQKPVSLDEICSYIEMNQG
ncbi:ATP-binding protein [Alteromonas facilis]|uniref:ATP-binding protein n=1 Tax=Alteromonas facilis TaxID=2048004 RepID=UPI000C2823D1|nr:ATP-binding protein [Alteromonas facilis]